MRVGIHHPHPGPFSFEEIGERGSKPHLVRVVVMNMRSSAQAVNLRTVAEVESGTHRSFKLREGCLNREDSQKNE